MAKRVEFLFCLGCVVDGWRQSITNCGCGDEPCDDRCWADMMVWTMVAVLLASGGEGAHRGGGDGDGDGEEGGDADDGDCMVAMTMAAMAMAAMAMAAMTMVGGGDDGGW